MASAASSRARSVAVRSVALALGTGTTMWFLQTKVLSSVMQRDYERQRGRDMMMQADLDAAALLDTTAATVPVAPPVLLTNIGAAAGGEDVVDTELRQELELEAAMPPVTRADDADEDSNGATDGADASLPLATGTVLPPASSEPAAELAEVLPPPPPEPLVEEMSLIARVVQAANNVMGAAVRDNNTIDHTDRCIAEESEDALSAAAFVAPVVRQEDDVDGVGPGKVIPSTSGSDASTSTTRSGSSSSGSDAVATPDPLLCDEMSTDYGATAAPAAPTTPTPPPTAPTPPAAPTPPTPPIVTAQADHAGADERSATPEAVERLGGRKERSAPELLVPIALPPYATPEVVEMVVEVEEREMDRPNKEAKEGDIDEQPPPAVLDFSTYDWGSLSGSLRSKAK